MSTARSRTDHDERDDARRDRTEPTTSLGVLDRALYALFSRHADRSRHDHDRKRYRATDVRIGFDVLLSRIYGLSWLASLATVGVIVVVGITLPAGTVATVTDRLTRGAAALPLVPTIDPARTVVGGGGALAGGALVKYGVVRSGGLYLRWRANARQAGIEQTLPAAVRYLRALSAGSSDGRLMLQKVARNPGAYGDTAIGFRKALNKATLTGSLDDGLRMVARDTPSQDVLAPFLLKFREHANQGPDELEGYLAMESRMLSHRQSRRHERAKGFLELLAEIFIVLLVLPALLVIILTVLSVLSPSFGSSISTPFGSVTLRTAIVYGSATFVLFVGAIAAMLVGSLRPPSHSVPEYDRPRTIGETLSTAGTNPESAIVVAAPVAVGVAVFLSSAGLTGIDVALLSYVAFALPVGLVALHRARIDDAKDREIKDFVHAVSGHVSLGRPFTEAVEIVAREVDLGALEADVHELAFNSNLTTRRTDDSNDATGDALDGGLRTEALRRFVESVGTPLAEQTMGLVTGALAVGSDTEAVFESLQTEIGRLYHEKKSLRATMLVYVAVGWTTALLIAGIMIAVNAYVLEGFTRLAELSGSTSGFGLDPNAVQPERDKYRFYVVTQATMLACGWFAGMASRGWYEALLHSGALVGVTYLVFTGVGMI